MGRKLPFLLSLGRHSKLAGDEGNLPSDVSFIHPSDLPLANHVQHLVSLQPSPCRFNRKEAHPRLDQSLDKTVVLLGQVIEVFDLSEFDRFGKRPAGLELSNGSGIGRILVDIDHTRSR